MILVVIVKGTFVGSQDSVSSLENALHFIISSFDHSIHLLMLADKTSQWGMDKVIGVLLRSVLRSH